MSCSERLVAAGVRKVVVGCIDLDNRTRGKGIMRLHDAGIIIERASPMIEDELLDLLGDGNFTNLPNN